MPTRNVTLVGYRREGDSLVMIRQGDGGEEILATINTGDLEEGLYALTQRLGGTFSMELPLRVEGWRIVYGVADETP